MAEAVLADFRLSQERAGEAHEAEVVQGDDDRKACSPCRAQRRGRHGGEQIVEVDDVWAVTADRLVELSDRLAPPDHVAGESDIGSPGLGLAHDRQHLVPGRPEEVDLVLDDAILARRMPGQVARVDDQDPAQRRRGRATPRLPYTRSHAGAAPVGLVTQLKLPP